MRRPSLFVLTLLAACATPVDPSPRDGGVEMPEQWTASDPEAEAGPPPDAWWDSFNDPMLVTLVSEALQHNRDLQAAVARVDAAIARATIAGADLYPQLAAGLDGRRTSDVIVGFPISNPDGSPLSFTTNSYGLSLDLSWEVDLWGRIRAGKLAASTDMEAAAAELRAARLSIAAQTAKVWFSSVEAHQQFELAEQSAATFRRTADRVRERFDSGVRPALDLRLAESDLQEAEALVEVRRRLRHTVLRELQILIGHYPDAAVDPDAALPEIIDPVPAGLPSELLQRRPDLVAAERRLAAADARLGEAKASLYPRLTLTASGGSKSAELEDMADFDFSVWALGGNIVAPLFQGGRLTANVELKDAERRQAIAEFGGAMLTAFREVETSLANEEMLEDEEQRRIASVEQSRAARALSEDRYSRGLDDIVTLLTSQRRELQAKTRLLDVRRMRLENRIDLLLALGGGFPQSPLETALTETPNRPEAQD